MDIQTFTLFWFEGITAMIVATFLGIWLISFIIGLITKSIKLLIIIAIISAMAWTSFFDEIKTAILWMM